MGPVLLQDVRQSTELPVLPDLALHALELTEQATGDTPPLTLRQLIATDPEIEGKILRAANCGFYKISRPISDIEDALNVLSTRTIQILLAALVISRELMRFPTEGIDKTAYWRRSVLSAASARSLAELLRSPHVETCFLIGLLMDMGMLLMSRLLGSKYTQVLEQTPNHTKLCDAENAALGTTHAEAAGALAQRWKLSAILRVPISAHHDPSRVKADALRGLADIVCLSGRCSDIFLQERPTETLCEVRNLCSERFSISALKADALLCTVSRAARDLAPIFDLTPDRCFSYEAALQRAADDNFVAETTMPGGVLPTAVPKSERRRAKRISRDGFIAIYPRNGGVLGSPTRVGFHDVSSVGIGLKSTYPMAAGMQFVIKLPHGEKLIPVIYKVIRCIPLSKGIFHIGAEVSGVMRDMD